jgi:hypothetical protein
LIYVQTWSSPVQVEGLDCPSLIGRGSSLGGSVP